MNDVSNTHLFNIIVFRGLPGSGKSTLAKSYVARDPENRSYYEMDMFFTDEDGNYKFDGNQIKDAVKWCQDKVTEDFLAGKQVIVSNTHTRNFEFDYYIGLAKDNGVDCIVVECKNNFVNTHEVGNDKIEIMRNRWEEVDMSIYPNRTIVVEFIDDKIVYKDAVLARPFDLNNEYHF